MENFKNCKYGDEFFMVEGLDIFKYFFIHVEEEYNRSAYFKKVNENNNTAEFVCMHMQKNI